MSFSTEPIFVALFNLLKTAATFNTASRFLKSWEDLAPADQPALFLAQRDENVAIKFPGAPPVSVFTADVYVYARSDDPGTTLPSTILNALVDAVKATIGSPDNASTNKLTLGGLVQHVWIEGRITTDEGVLGHQSVAIIPISIKVA